MLKKFSSGESPYWAYSSEASRWPSSSTRSAAEHPRRSAARHRADQAVSVSLMQRLRRGSADSCSKTPLSVRLRCFANSLPYKPFPA